MHSFLESIRSIKMRKPRESFLMVPERGVSSSSINIQLLPGGLVDCIMSCSAPHDSNIRSPLRKAPIALSPKT